MNAPRSKNQTTTPWTAEHCEFLKRRWEEGASATVIAEEMGLPFTRSSVTGKASRLKLAGAAVKADARTRSDDPLDKLIRINGRTLRAAEKSNGSGPAEEVVDYGLVIPEGQRIRSILDLTDSSCRWPVGDVGAEDFYFCGGKIAAQSYCAHHRRIAYEPAHPRRTAARG